MALKQRYELVLSVAALIILLISIFTWSWEFVAVFAVIMAFLIALLLKA